MEESFALVDVPATLLGGVVLIEHMQQENNRQENTVRSSVNVFMM